MMIVMPMAGRGSRYAGKGFTEPKPFIKVLDRPIFSWALESLQGIEFQTLIVVLLREHEIYLHQHRDKFPKQSEFIFLNNITDGQLCTVLAAREMLMEAPSELLVISSDTLVQSPLGNDIRNSKLSCSGLISVIDLPGEQWSFARTDDEGRVVEVTEKVRISNNASTGLYYFKNSHDFVSLGEQMVANQEKTRGEYYIMPLYQKFIQRGDYIGISKATEMWDIGTPEAATIFEQSRVGGKLSKNDR